MWETRELSRPSLQLRGRGERDLREGQDGDEHLHLGLPGGVPVAGKPIRRGTRLNMEVHKDSKLKKILEISLSPLAVSQETVDLRGLNNKSFYW